MYVSVSVAYAVASYVMDRHECGMILLIQVFTRIFPKQYKVTGHFQSQTIVLRAELVLNWFSTFHRIRVRLPSLLLAQFRFSDADNNIITHDS